MNAPRRPRGRSDAPADQRAAKRPFDIHRALRQIRAAGRTFPRAALFELADEGFASVFEQVVACIISVRTRDETTLVVARRLFARARTPAEMIKLTTDEIDQLIHPSTFHEAKARNLLAIARLAESQHRGELPCDAETLLALPGVGPKCANLVLGIACNQSHISVDIHVHRVTNRWGYVQASTPDKTRAALEAKLPKRYWIEINSVLVPFGKHICTGPLPKCSTCPVLDICQQVGVTTHR